jgi:hypothetical protein
MCSVTGIRHVEKLSFSHSKRYNIHYNLSLNLKLQYYAKGTFQWSQHAFCSASYCVALNTSLVVCMLFGEFIASND